MYNSYVGTFLTYKNFGNRLYIGNRTYPSVTFNVAYLSVFLYLSVRVIFQLSMEVMISASSLSDS